VFTVRSRVHVAVDVYDLYLRLVEAGIYFISVDELAKILATSTRSAGRVLSKMYELGLAVRLSKNTYKLIRF